MIVEMLVRELPLRPFRSAYFQILDIQTLALLQSAPSAEYPQFRLQTEASAFIYLFSTACQP
jgi:hypothetical protein